MPKTVGITGIILAGGASRRMGRDKAHLPWGDATLIEHVVETLRPSVDELLVVVKDAREFVGLEARVVEDLVPDAHALGGLYTGLTLAASERCFVCACDHPFFNPQLVRLLCEQLEGIDLVIPKTGHGLQPLHAAYARSALPAIQEQLRQRRWDVRALVPKLRTRVIDSEQWRPFDRGGLSFFNLNMPAEYAMAQRLAAKRSRHR
jgi:molybdopterin-guanine dinucleotide biosynthesis protein A